MKKIVIVGAGYAGVLTAKKLAKRFQRREDVHISIIDRNPFHTMLTELHEVAAGRVEQDSIKIDLKRVFAGRRVKVILDTIETIDFNRKSAVGKEQAYPYDYLVLAAGSEPTFFGVSGAAEFSWRLWSYDDAVRLHERIHDCFRRAARETDDAARRRLLTFYVVGAGFTGVEMIGELAEYLPVLCRSYQMKRGLVSLYNVDILPRPVPMLPEKLSEKVVRRLTKMGVTVRMNTGVVGVGPDYIEMKAGEQVEREAVGTVIWTAGIESSGITADAAKTLPAGRRGCIRLDAHLNAVGHKDIFVAGDNMLYTPAGEQAPVPQMVENCEQSAHTVARNLAAAITGEKQEDYAPQFHGVMVCVGGRYGVAHVGLPGHFFALPSFLAMFAKHFINVIYLFQVLGWNKVCSYLRHEFFTVRNCRSFLGGHFSNRTPSFLLVPMRVWLGVVWLFEGVMKLLEGWMTNPMLTDFFGGANTWYNAILQKAGAPAVGGMVVDAVSAATAEGAADAVLSGTALFSVRILGLFSAIFVSGSEPATATLADYAFRLDLPLINQSVNAFVLPYDGVQVFMQGAIVIAEILIGLALIGGLFTFPASAASLVLQFMFVCTTGLYLNTMWMIFAAIAVLIGGGRTFGLDYYVMPMLKEWWQKLPLIRKWYLYND